MSKSAFHAACRLAVGVCVVALVMHTWLVMGLVVPVTVSGSSMAPTLRGPHCVFRCDACRCEFQVGYDELPDVLVVDCPKCGRRSTRPVADRRGDRLLVDRTAFAFRQPRRWELVVFRCPADAQQLCVKRIVGLPGETVSLAGGNVSINGRLIPQPRDTDYEIRYGDHPQNVAVADGDGMKIQAGWRLGPSEYFVLGDNAAISDDSRNWIAGPGLDAKLLIGRLLGVR